MLFVFGGLPGSGKTTLSKALAAHSGAVHLRIDTIEQALRRAGVENLWDHGYLVAYGLALDNLRLGRSVIGDSVNPIEITRADWRAVAERAGCGVLEVHVTCSDAKEHQNRVESRVSDIEGLKQPTWQQVVDREFEPWNSANITIDTAGETPTQSVSRLMDALDARDKRQT